jgi:putative oxidoreductase
MKLGALAIRGVVGPLFVGHGTQKLFGWFGGHGPEGTGQFFESLGLRPGKRHATSAGVAEALGGAMLTLGLLTPVATALITGAMVTAIRLVHGDKGPWMTEGGYEYNAVVIASLLAVTENGPGPLSIDEVAFARFHGTACAIAAVGAGVAASYAATSPPLNEPAPSEPQAQPEPAQAVPAS